jgi:mannose-6-phosphate isomerase-like protein (cupin superfamily)
MSGMQTISLEQLGRTIGGTARFEGEGNGASVSFFVVRSLPGDGAEKHRHPYDETFIILEGLIEVVIAGERAMVESGTIAVIPAMTWHEFTNRGTARCLMVNVHASPTIIQENWADRVDWSDSDDLAD